MNTLERKEHEYYKSLYYETLDDVKKYEKEVNEKIVLLQNKVAKQAIRIGKLLNQVNSTLVDKDDKKQ